MSTPEYVGGPACGDEVPAHLLCKPRIVLHTHDGSRLYLYIRLASGDYGYVSMMVGAPSHAD